METAAVSKLKANLSEYLLKVKLGEEIVVTDRGRPIARIIPVRRGEKGISPHLLTLEKAGLARIGSGKLPDEFWTRPRPKDVEGVALDNLIDERRGGR